MAALLSGIVVVFIVCHTSKVSLGISVDRQTDYKAMSNSFDVKGSFVPSVLNIHAVQKFQEEKRAHSFKNILFPGLNE